MSCSAEVNFDFFVSSGRISVQLNLCLRRNRKITLQPISPVFLKAGKKKKSTFSSFPQLGIYSPCEVHFLREADIRNSDVQVTVTKGDG